MLENIISKTRQGITKISNKVARAKERTQQYTKQKILIPAAIGLMGLGLAINPQQTKAQTFPTQPRAITTADTIWGYGTLLTKDAETGSPLGYVNVEFTPDTMQMVTPDTTYYYQSNNSGIVHYNVPAGIDIQDRIEEKHETRNKGSQITVYPNPSNAFNIITDETNPLQSITVFNLNGQEIITLPVNSSHAFVDLSYQPAGIYLFRAVTKDNEVFSGKLVKNSVPLARHTEPDCHAERSRSVTNGLYIIRIKTKQGQNITKKFIKTNKQAYENNTTNTTSNHQKESKEIYNATYSIKCSKEGYYDSTITVNIHEGENDIIRTYLQEKPPGTWKIISIARDGDSLIAFGNNGDSIPAPLAGVKAYLYINNGPVIASDTTDSTGIFIFDSIPQNTEVVLTIGDKDGYYSYGGIHWTTPGGLPNGVDSVRNDSVFNTLLKRQITDANGNIIPAVDIWAMNLDGTRYDTVWYWFSTNSNGIGFTSLAKSQINNDIHQLQITEHNVYTYVESPTPRPGNKGIKIMPGSNATNASQGNYNTPLGQFHPTDVINMWLSNTTYLGTWHEFKRATGYDGVTYYSIMRDDAPGYTEEDRKIAEKFIRGYLNMVYHVNTSIPDSIITSYINLNNIRDSTGFNQQMMKNKTININDYYKEKEEQKQKLKSQTQQTRNNNQYFTSDSTLNNNYQFTSDTTINK